MNREQFEEIFDNTKSKWDGDNAFQGLLILRKYIKYHDVICGAEHDEIYSVDVDEILEAGITEEDATDLAKLNWHIDSECHCLACFV